MTKNQNRIKKLSEMVSKRVVAEIGADHGFITKYLFDNNKIDYSFLTDISDACLNKSRKNLVEYASRTTFLVGDGLTVLDRVLAQKTNNFVPEEIIIAGMGGKEIIKILSQDKNHFKHFILGPQRNVVDLRKYLLANNFYIEKDIIAKEGKMFYNILKVVSSEKKQELNPLELHFGKTNLDKMPLDFIEYVSFRKNYCERILSVSEVKLFREELELLNKINLGEKYV